MQKERETPESAPKAAPADFRSDETGAEPHAASGDLLGFGRDAEPARGDDSLPPGPPLTRVAREKQLPLSFAQHRLWSLHRHFSNTPLHRNALALTLSGTLDIELLERALLEIVRRHEILRTTFTFAEGEPAQVIRAPQPLHLTPTDLSELPEPERREEAQRLAAEEARKPFDLSAGPLVRAALLRLGEEEHMLLLTLHHIVSDGWSTSVLIKEFAALYEAYSEGRPSPLPELEVQYADYAVWQREWLQGEVLEGQLQYWREQLAGAPALLELPTDRPRPAVQSHLGARLPVSLPAGLSAKLRALSRREGVTLFMTLLAAFDVLLWRYTGQEDLVVGTPIAGRTRRETEGLIGFFVNTLALRARVEGGESFRELLRRVKETALSAYAHQEVPFERVVEELQPERDLSRTPLFQVSFALQNMPAAEVALPGLRLEAVELDNKTAEFDLSLEVNDDGDTLDCYLRYSLDRFERGTVERMAGHLTRLLEGLAADPSRPLAEVGMLSEGERRQQLEGWNATRGEYPRGQAVHRLFEQQAHRTPDRAAVQFEDEELSYAELNRRANRVARHLRSLGVGPEVRVGVCMERSVGLVVALLGVLKAGGAYVPLDQSHPPERLAFMLRDSEVPVVLVQEHLLELISERAIQTVCIDADGEAISRQSDLDLPEAADGDGMAYVVYTSGSTGQPKGVMTHHAGLAARAGAMAQVYGLDQTHRLLQFLSIGFDAAAEEVFPTLISGATLVLMRDPQQVGGAELLLACERLSITCLHLPAAYWHQMVNEIASLQRPVPSSIKVLITGGEAVSVQHLQRWVELTRHPAKYFNAYGPTEATITATTFELPINPSAPRSVLKVPIGLPMPGTAAYVLDSWRGPVPEGVSGELYLGGVGVARGYLNRPGLTAERFLPDPYSEELGARMYRTGDRVRRLAGGELEYLGRADDQVKVRGYRIELGEVEAALLRHGRVAEAVVLVRGEGAAASLVAFFRAKGEDEVGGAELREHARRGLPEYMVPGRFVGVPEMPLTPNGKVDKKALAALADEDAGALGEGGQGYEAPQTPTEEIVAGIWAEVLGAGRVGRSENFFELGGHSLLATQVVTRMQEVFNVEATLRVIFDGPTVAEQAQFINEAQSSQKAQEEIDLLQMVDGLSLEELDALLEQAAAEGL